MKYLLIEVIGRDINTPAFFNSYQDAHDEMCYRFAQVLGISSKQVRTAYLNGEYSGEPDKPYFGSRNAWADTKDVKLDWSIFDIKECCG